MNPLWGHFIGGIILMLMLVFIGIWIWAWRPQHKLTFAALAQLPMHDPADAEHETASQDETR